MIKNLFLLIAIYALSACSSTSNDSVKAYTYFIDINTCKQKQINYCPIIPVSEVLFALPKNSSTIRYRDIALSDSNLKTYGKLENCTVFDNENFKCDDLELVDGKFNLINAFSINQQGEIVKNNDNFFSNYFAISSSKSLYYISSVKPTINLGVFNQTHYEIVYFAILLFFITAPFTLAFMVFGLVSLAFEFLKDFLATGKN